MKQYKLYYEISLCPVWWRNFVHSIIPGALLQSAIEMCGAEAYVWDLLSTKYAAHFDSNAYLDKHELTFFNEEGYMLFMLEWS